MALPNPNPDGTATADSQPSGLKAFFGSGVRSEKKLIELNKNFDKLLETQKNMLEIIKEAFGGPKKDPDEVRKLEDTAGGEEGKDLDLKKILEKSGGFGMIFGAALVAYALDLDKYIRTAFIGSKVFGPLVKGVSSTFAKLSATFGKLFNAKAFTTAIKPFTTAFDNFMAGFKNVGKVIGAVKAPVAIKEFTTVFGKIGATIGSIVKPFMTGFKTVSDVLGKVLSPIGAIFKSVGGVFSSIFKALGPFIKIAAKFMQAIPIVGQIIMLLFGIFDFVTGFIKGFSEGGILGGLKEGAMELVRGFLTKPLDLLTKGIAYLMGFFGFDNIKASIDEFLQGGGITGLFNEAMAALGKAFDVVLQFFKDLFNDPIGTLKSAAENIGDFFVNIAKSIGNAIGKMKDGLLEMLGLSGKSSQAERGGGGGSSFNISELFKDLDFSFLSPAKIGAKLGEMINNALQGFAQSLDKSIVPGTDTLGSLVSKTGVSIAELLGAENIQKYQMGGMMSEGKMETLKKAAPPTASEGTAAGEMSKEVAAKKETPPPAVVDSSTTTGDTVNNNSKTEVKAGKVESRATDNPSAGRRRRGGRRR